MFRRLSVNLPALAASCGRFYTPSDDLKKLYASDFDKTGFPCNIVPSDSVLFAKFLYKAADGKNAHEAILKDFKIIAASVPSLPVFWERTAKVADIQQFKALSPATTFTLEWMQANGMLDLLPEVAEVYDTYVNAKLKRVVGKIYVATGKAENKAILEQGKKAADKIAKENKEFAGFSVTYRVIVDRSIIEGFAVEVQGVYDNHATGRQSAADAVDEVDYTNVPIPQPHRTSWEDNIETEVLRKYLDSLADYDAEELKNGI